MMSSREWLALFDTIDDDEPNGHSVNPEVKPISLDVISELVEERDRLKALIADLENDTLHRLLEAAEKRGFVIQLVPGRLYQPPQEA